MDESSHLLAVATFACPLTNRNKPRCRQHEVYILRSAAKILQDNLRKGLTFVGSSLSSICRENSYQELGCVVTVQLEAEAKDFATFECFSNMILSFARLSWKGYEWLHHLLQSNTKALLQA